MSPVRNPGDPAHLKVIFDEIPQLHPYGYILGKEEEGIEKEEAAVG